MPHTIARLNYLVNQLRENISLTSSPLFMTKEVCDYCHGTGEVPTDVFDPDSGQDMQGVGEMKKCICQIK